MCLINFCRGDAVKNVIVTGATGMIGSRILQDCLKRDDVGIVTSVARRPSGLQHPKLREIVHVDFRNFSQIADHFENQDVCFYCLGVCTGRVDRESFREITVDYTVAFAETLKRHCADSVFCFLSGQGADVTEKSRVMFARDKGAAENALRGMSFRRLHIFRPGYIYPVEPRREPNLTYRLMRAFYRPVSFLYPNIGTTSDELGAAMISAAFVGCDKTVLENRDIREMPPV